jgi:formylmethanofuran dehydrogenase subunit E
LPVEEDELETALNNAVRLHGHLGPFLAIGVRMGRIAKRNLTPKAEGDVKMQATLKIPLYTPFSCVIDGVQATTNCTIGNQKLRIENSHGEIFGRFELQNLSRTLEIIVNPDVIEGLAQKMSKGIASEELATQVAFMPESQLFKKRACSGKGR